MNVWRRFTLRLAADVPILTSGDELHRDPCAHGGRTHRGETLTSGGVSTRSRTQLVTNSAQPSIMPRRLSNRSDRAYERSTALPTWCASAASATACGTLVCSLAQSRNEERKPCTRRTAASRRAPASSRASGDPRAPGPGSTSRQDCTGLWHVPACPLPLATTARDACSFGPMARFSAISAARNRNWRTALGGGAPINRRT